MAKSSGADIILPIAILGGGVIAFFLFQDEIMGAIGELTGGLTGGEEPIDGEVPAGDGEVPAGDGDGGGGGGVDKAPTGKKPSSKPPKVVIPPNQVPTTTTPKPKSQPKVKVPAKKKRKSTKSTPKTQTPRACSSRQFRATTGKCLTIPHCTGSQYTGQYNKTTGKCIRRTVSSATSGGCPPGRYMRSGSCLTIPRCTRGYSFSATAGRCVKTSSYTDTAQSFYNSLLDRIFVA